MLFGRIGARLLRIPLVLDDGPKSSFDQKPLLPPPDDQKPLLPSPHCDPSTPFCDDFNRLVQNALHQYHVPGLAIAIVDGDETRSRGYGMAQLPDVRVSRETMFFTGSTTKAFTTAAISLLIDDQNTSYPGLKWTTPISELIPEDFKLMDDYSTRHVTLQDAASHRTGLPRHDQSVSGGNQTAKDVARSLRHLPLTKPFRTTFQYCNLMYAVLGYVVEVLSGQWLGDFFAERIWAPLGMTHTYLSLKDALSSGKPLAQGYEWVDVSQSFQEMKYDNLSAEAGAGAVISNVVDYARWVKMMMRREAPISKAGHEALVTPHMIVGKEIDSMGLQMYGYGWQIEQYRGQDIVSHGGAVTGFGANVLYMPQKDWACIIMTNSLSESLAVTDTLTWHLVDEKLNVPQAERANRQDIWDDLEKNRHLKRNETFVRDYLFPPRQVGNLSASLPLDKYAGDYTNPGYGDLTISYEHDGLWNHLDRGPNMKWDTKFNHISGDHFFVFGFGSDQPEDPLFTKAEFIVDVSGRVVKLGVLLEDEMWEDKIWFERRRGTK